MKLRYLLGIETRVAAQVGRRPHWIPRPHRASVVSEIISVCVRGLYMVSSSELRILYVVWSMIRIATLVLQDPNFMVRRING